MRIVLATLSPFLVLVSSLAQGADYQVFPVKGVFYPRDGSATLIHDDFRASAAADGGDYFEKTFRAAFPAAAKTIDDANKRRTFAVSLQVARASFYTVMKPTGVVDIYLPMTASLYFSNVTTGEVLFATTKTDIPLGSVMRADVEAPGHARVRELFGRYFRELIDELVMDARKNFNPRTITATVRDDWKKLAILDAGQDKGLAVDDSLVDERGDELRVVSVGPSYSTAKAELGSFSSGMQFSRVTNRTLAEIRKPRVLAFIDESPAEFPDETLVQFFSDALGASSRVSLVPVNRTYAQVLQAVATRTELSQEQLQQREVPNFFIRLHVFDPITFDVPTDRPNRTRRVTEGFAFAEVQDRSGRVLAAGYGKDRVEDEILYGVGLSVANRREIVVKNTLLDLANRLGGGLNFKQAQLVTTAVGDVLSIRDDSGLLSAGGSAHLFRSLGHIAGIQDEVLVPTWEIEVLDDGEGAAHAKASLPITDGVDAPRKGDLVLAQSVERVRATRRRLGPCGGVEKLGAIELPGYEELSLNLFASSFAAPFYLPGLSKRAAMLVSSGCGFRSSEQFREPEIDLCVQPVYRIDETELKCSDGACADVTQVRLTYRLRRNKVDGDVTAKRGLETRMKSTELPMATSTQARAASLRGDLLDEAIELAPQVAAGFSEEKL